MSRPTLAALALATLVLVTGCSGDDEKKPAPAAESSAGPSAADTLVHTGLRQLEAGEDAKARATFENVLELDRENVYAHYNLGLLDQKAGRTKDAGAHYDAALATEPEFAPALYNKGILLEASDLEGAVDLYRRALDVDPKLAAAHMRLGFALLHLGETKEAEEHLATGVELDPSMANVEAPSYD
ncbi:tetratricopeptide repeat protein [Nocardioides nitrophenolicus]|uniref:tetratricopeptide repeat protein n=1 Tax=Nocardioides nitrophenolicus TaxID=60489 RepID=UPI001961C888|nr:tetratricopeptide repeat protein [Nocardioides nitrophenolicus]MBM7520485.1 Tfp pilus assembly protein PilF [Nocardioides nitrophenolicus]